MGKRVREVTDAVRHAIKRLMHARTAPVRVAKRAQVVQAALNRMPRGDYGAAIALSALGAICAASRMPRLWRLLSSDAGDTPMEGSQHV